MKQTDPQYKLRLPQELKDLVEAAKRTGRSMNAEVVARLQTTFEAPCWAACRPRRTLRWNAKSP